MKKNTILSLLLCFSTAILYAQNQDNTVFTGCGADLMRKLHPELRTAQERNDLAACLSSTGRTQARNAGQALRTLPVVVHIVHNGGSENITDAQVQQGIAQLNAAFDATFGTGVNTELQFCLAQRDPQGQATTGITRDQSTLTSFDMDFQDLPLKNLNRWQPTCYINIWVVAAINSGSSGNGVVGYAYFPSAHGLNVDGIVMEAAYFGSSQANTGVLVHEMGHYLGLYHTFEGGCGNNDCLQDGDRVCDTPPDQTTFSSCNPNANSCSTDADDTSGNNPFTADVPDLGEDYMDYSTLQCFSKFTQGQSDRMNWHLTNIRSSLLGCLSCQSPCPAPVSASITSPVSPQTITVGNTLNFSGTATNTSDYTWNIGSDPAFATTLNTSFAFNSVGVFWIKFTAVSGNPAECFNAVDSVQVTVLCDAQAVFSVPPLIENGTPVTFTNNSTNATDYQWSIDNVPVSTDADLTYTFTNTGVYQLCLRAGNTSCSSTLCATVYVQQNGGTSTGCDNTFIKSLAGMGGSRPNIFPHPSGDFFATGLRNDSIVIVRFDQGGTALWARAFKINNQVLQIRDMFVDASGDLIGVAHAEGLSLGSLKSTAFRYNLTSNSFIWIQDLPGSYYTQINSKDAANCVLTGLNDAGSTQFIELSKSTGAVSGYNLVGEQGDFYSTIYNGSIFGACRRYESGNSFRASVFAHDLNSGAFQWQNSIISSDIGAGTRMYPEKPIVDNDKLVVVASGDLQGFGVYTFSPVELVVAQTSLTGDVLWTKQYIIAGFDRPVAMAIVATATGYYVVCNLYQDALGNFGYGAIIKTDKQGQVEWAKRLGISGKNIARNIMERNGYLYLTMSSDSYAPNDLLLVKLDQDGNTNTDCDFVQSIAVSVVNLVNIQDERNYSTNNSGPSPIALSTLSAAISLETVTYCNTPCLCPDLPISAGADTTVCQGTSVTLLATAGFDTYQWSPAATLDDPSIQNPVATPLVTTTYTVDAMKWGIELVTNSDFSQGNTGFISEYVYGTTGYGHYWVTDNPLLYNPQWNIPNDHSPTTDNMMQLFDGSVTGTLPLLWQQSVAVESNKDYTFQFWGAMAYFAAPPVIEVKMNGVVQGTFTLQGGNQWVGVWQPFSLNINSGGATLLNIEIKNLNLAALGNDFAFDDISLRTMCHYTDSITVIVNNGSVPTLDLGPDIMACVNAVHTFDAGAGFESYLWQNGSTDQTFTAFGPGTYWVTALDSCGGIQTDTVQVILAPTPTLDLGPDQSICAGDSIQLSYTSNGVFDNHNWSPASGLSCTLCPSPWAAPATTTVFYLAASTADGCTNLDSVVVTVLQHSTSEQNITRCDDEPFVFNGHTYTESGTYLDTLTATNGCDSVVTTHLVFLDHPVFAETVAFCPGDSVTIGGNIYSTPGTVVDTIPSVNGGCDTVATYTLQYLTPAPSTVNIDCPDDVYVAVQPGTGTTVVTYDLPLADSDCACPGISLTLTAGLASGDTFPTGNTQVCYTAKDSCGNTASCCFDVFVREESACDIKDNGCMKYELLTITADPGQNYTYRIRVTNNCANELIYTAIQIPDGVTAMEPADLSTFEAESGRDYSVRNPNYSPFWSIRFKSDAAGITNGQSDIFEYTLPAQAVPVYIHITSKLATQDFYEAHLNTFYCPVGITPTGDKSLVFRANRTLAKIPELRIFPNPSDGSLFVDIPELAEGKVDIRIFNAQGQEVQLISASDIETPYQIRLSEGLANGLYTLHFTTNAGAKQTARFVLQQ